MSLFRYKVKHKAEMKKETERNQELFKALHDKIDAKLKKNDSLKVLIICVDESERVFGNKLTTYGCKVSMVESVEKALELDVNSFDAVIANMEMPGMTGLDMVKQLNGKHPRVKKVVTSSLPLDKDKIKEIEDEGAYYYSRPFGISTIMRCLRVAF